MPEPADPEEQLAWRVPRKEVRLGVQRVVALLTRKTQEGRAVGFRHKVFAQHQRASKLWNGIWPGWVLTRLMQLWFSDCGGLPLVRLRRRLRI